MIHEVELHGRRSLADYGADLYLSDTVTELRQVYGRTNGDLKGRTLWIVNSTEQGGGVAEMLPAQLNLLRDLGIDARWVVIGAEEPRFFDFTKRIHNALHGMAEFECSAEDRAAYEAVSTSAAEALCERVQPEDILVIHDPQPLAVGALLKERVGMRSVWRCHIGSDEETPGMRAAWGFLEPWLRSFDRTVFTLREYAPPFLRESTSIIPPAIDPLDHKNRELSVHKLTGILCNSSLVRADQPVLYDAFDEPARRLDPSGHFVPANDCSDLGLLYRPVITQVSRWDRFKGFEPLLEGFVRLKNDFPAKASDPVHRRRLELARLVLVGPDPASIQDDPEGRGVLENLCQRWQSLDRKLQDEIGLLVLPMSSRKQNALMVNALQRCSTVVAQNSLREGFGLTATEAMWKGALVLGTRATGLRSQIEDGVHGRLVGDPEDALSIATALDQVLANPTQRSVLGRNARRRVSENFLVISQVGRWLELLSDLATQEASR